MNVDALPVPKLYNAIGEHHIRTLCRVFGIALLVQFFLPWSSARWFTIDFATIWTLVMGAGLTTLGFLDVPALKRGHLWAITGGAAAIGLISIVALGGQLPGFVMLSVFGILGTTATVFGLFLWARQGHSALAYWIVIGGLGAVALSLLIPTGGQMPIVAMFKVFGAPAFNIVLRIFFFLLSAAFIAAGVLTLLFVVLKADKADDGWVKLMGVVFLLLIPLSLLVIGLLGMFDHGALLLAMFHVIIIAVTHIFLTIAAGIVLLDAAQSGRLKGMFGLG